MTKLEALEKSSEEIAEYFDECSKSLPDPKAEKRLNAAYWALWAMRMVIEYGKVWEDKG